MEKKWWHDAIIYQIYLRSFQDANQDGIGDLQGIIRRLDYLKSLNINTIWISPHYDSPMDDNGYDVRDFYKVSPDYGTIDDFKDVLAAAHERDMKVLVDLVLNHTSDEHPWFLAAKDPDHPEHEHYHDFYIWHDGILDKNGKKKPPTRWISWFGGPVWQYVPALDQYYLHIFSKKMPDLNWRNTTMREELKKMIAWWIELGVDGFRVDASNHLEKNWEFPDAKPGYEHFSSLPKHHEYLKELARELFIPNDLLVIGEAGGATRKEALQYAGFDSEEFNLLIQFEHCWADTDDQNVLTPGKWAKGIIDLPKIKHSFAKWIEIFKNRGYHTLYWHNHDQPRVVSHYGNDKHHHERSAKMLAYTLYLLPGIPIIYYGEEIGMTNVDYTELDQFRDVEVFTEYNNFIRNGASHNLAMQALKDRCRDNARTPMQWDPTPNGGFSAHQPWIDTNRNTKAINVTTQEKDDTSILNTYRKLLSLRKSEDIANAEVTFIDIDNPRTFFVKIAAKTHDYLVLANFKGETIHVDLPEDLTAWQLYLHNTEPHPHPQHFEPYEARIYRKAK